MVNWKGFGRKWAWPSFKVLLWHLPGGTEENHIKLNWDSQFPGQDFNPEPPEYKVGVLTTQPRCSVI
jgi:hypothetical protein